MKGRELRFLSQILIGGAVLMLVLAIVAFFLNLLVLLLPIVLIILFFWFLIYLLKNKLKRGFATKDSFEARGRDFVEAKGRVKK